MLFLDFKAHFLCGMMLGDTWKNSTNQAFSSREFKKKVYSSTMATTVVK